MVSLCEVRFLQFLFVQNRLPALPKPFIFLLSCCGVLNFFGVSVPQVFIKTMVKIKPSPGFTSSMAVRHRYGSASAPALHVIVLLRHCSSSRNGEAEGLEQTCRCGVFFFTLRDLFSPTLVGRAAVLPFSSALHLLFYHTRDVTISYRWYTQAKTSPKIAQRKAYLSPSLSLSRSRHLWRLCLKCTVQGG